MELLYDTTFAFCCFAFLAITGLSALDRWRQFMAWARKPGGKK